MLSRTKFAITSPDMFLNVWYLNSKTVFCLQTLDQPNNWKLLVLACLVLACKNILQIDFYRFLFCIHQTCKYKFSTGICKSGTCMQKLVFACTECKNSNTCRNWQLQVSYLHAKMCWTHVSVHFSLQVPDLQIQVSGLYLHIWCVHDKTCICLHIPETIKNVSGPVFANLVFTCKKHV